MARSRKQKPAPPPPLRSADASALIDKAVALHREGRVDEARKAYKDVLAAIPRHPDALHLLGIIAFQAGENDEALGLVDKAIAANSSTASFHSTRGNVLQTLGRFDAAVKSFDKAIALKPDYAAAYSNRGAALRKLGRAADAVSSCDKAITLAPDLAEAHSNRAAALQDLDRFDEALLSFDRAIELRGDLADAHFGRANVLSQSAKIDLALAAYGQALALNPQFADALINRAFAFESVQRFDEALADVDAFLALQPELVDAHILRAACFNGLSRHAEALSCADGVADSSRADLQLQRGFALFGLGRMPEAIAAFEAAIAAQPDYVEALFALAVALDQVGRSTETLSVCDRITAINPGLPEPHIRRGRILEDTGRLDEAYAAYRSAAAISPDHTDVLSGLANTAVAAGHPDEALAAAERLAALLPVRAQSHLLLGATFQRLGRFEDAVASYRRATSLDPGLAVAHANLGGALVELCRVEEAKASLVTSLRIDQNDANARWNLCLALLLSGDFHHGWDLYDSRFTKGSRPVERQVLDQPQWTGEDIAGKTILVHSEQGLGDTIQFVRYVPLLAARGARVLVDASATLVPLLVGLDGAAAVIATGDAVPRFDVHSPLPSLPKAFGTDIDSIPAAPAYLKSDPEKLKLWADRLGARSLPRVGLVWSGSTIHLNDRNRSLPLASLTPYLPDGIDYISLQKELRPSDAAALAARPDIRFVGDDLADFADTAALADLIDVVVSVDTSVVHLAGALGRPTYVLLPFSPDWRWMLGRSDSPWYPSLRLYRQASLGDWSTPLNQLRSDLEGLKRG